MAAGIRKRTKTRREVIKLLFNMTKTMENMYKQPQKESVYQSSGPVGTF